MVNRTNHPKTRILQAAKGRTMATLNGIEGICFEYVAGPRNQSMSFARLPEKRATHRGTQ